MENKDSVLTLLRAEIESSKAKLRNYKIGKDNAVLKAQEAEDLIEKTKREIYNLKSAIDKLEK